MKYKLLVIAAVAAILFNCSDNKVANNSAETNNSAKEKLAEKFGLTLFELENGIGPIKEKLILGPLDIEMSSKGQNLFEEKCASCHKLDERFTGPPQRDVIERRTPEYIMNMILNPEEMIAKHPEVKKMLAIYMTSMTFQNVSQEQAREILEYFRKVDKEK